MTKVYYTIFHFFALSAIIFIGVDAFYRIAGVKFQQVDGEKIRMQAAVGQKMTITLDYLIFRLL
jgi:hypothetical protein